MLSKAENEYLCRIGPGHADGQPHAPVLAAGHSLGRAARTRRRAPARATARRRPDRLPHHIRPGRPGPEPLPHRGASLFFGRNEEEGLRCVYHGWKFDVRAASASTCPTSPPNRISEPKSKPSPTPAASATASSGPIWARATTPPPLPDLEANMLGADDVVDLDHPPAVQLDAGLGRRDGHRPPGVPPLGRDARRRHRAGHVRLLHRLDAGAALRGRRYAVRHLVRRLAAGRGRHLLLAHRAHAVSVLRHDPGRADRPADAFRGLRARWTTSTRCTGRSRAGCWTRTSCRPKRAAAKVGRPVDARAIGVPAQHDRLVRPLQHGPVRWPTTI